VEEEEVERLKRSKKRRKVSEEEERSGDRTTKKKLSFSLFSLHLLHFSTNLCHAHVLDHFNFVACG